MDLPRFDRCFRAPDSSYFLFGPRGTGKSTWLASHYPDAFWIDLNDPETDRWYRARPERLEGSVAAAGRPSTIVIDEVQRVPELLMVVHRLIEADKGLTFVLTGSSARKLRTTGVDLLAGRALLRTMHPFMAFELGASFDLDSALLTGLVPLVVDAPNPTDTLRGYAALYLREEVQAEGLARNIGAFSRLLEAASFSHASVLNVANVARDCGIDRKVASGYLEILRDLLLSFELPVFTRRAKREMSVHPKFYFFDAGVFRSLRPKGPLDASEELGGLGLEGLVAQHLRAWIAYSGTEDTISFWRTRGGNEVDFILYGESGFHAIEVKNSRTIHPADFRGLRAFAADYPEATTTLLYRGTRSTVERGITCVPVDEFLRELEPGKALPIRGGSPPP